MKLRWRDHEIIFVSVLAASQIIHSLVKFYDPAFASPGFNPGETFARNNFPFVYWRNVLLPEIGLTLLLYFGYLSVNFIILPSIKKITFDDIERLLSANLIKAISGILVISFILALGANVITYYARPYLFNYGEYRFLGLLGYNDRPLTNLFFGVDREIWLVMVFTAILGLREFLIWILSKPGNKKEFRIMVANNLTPLLFGFFLVMNFLNPLNNEFRDYTAWTIPIICLYLYETFFLFPSSDRWWQSRPVLTRLAMAVVLCGLFCTIVSAGSKNTMIFLMYSLFLVTVITPISWLLFQHRKDRIMQLKGMEAALAKSSADLQFLRSQINPHFLFNALNTLHGTAWKENSEQTAQGIQQLGDMMRFMLHENHLDFIAIGKEIQYLRNYIALQKLRIAPDAGVDIEENIEEAASDHKIPPMLLIPLVENAFKHGISFKEKSWIYINLLFQENSICLDVRNSIHPASNSDVNNEKSGIGLKNVAERLKLIYPGRHELKVDSSGNEFVARLVIH